MPKKPLRKYDWEKIKVEYFEAKEQGLLDFLRRYFGKENVQTGAINAGTKGWFQEKQAFLRQVQAVAMQRAAAKAAKVYEPNMKELGEMHKATLELYKLSLNKILQDCIVKDSSWKTTIVELPNPLYLEKIWKVVKTEKGEATSVVERAEPITDDEKDFIESVLDDLDE